MLRGPVNTGPVPGRNGREARARRRESKGTSGTDGKTRKTDRSEIRCGERAERDRPREARETGGRHRGRAPGAPLGRGFGGGQQERPRGDPSCDAAETTRGLLLFRTSSRCRSWIDMTVTPGRYGAEVDALLEGL